MSISSVGVGLFCSKYRPKLVLVIYIGCVITSIGVALTYFAIQHSYFLTLLTYGCLNGIGVGIGYLTPLEVAMRWFPESRGFANSAILFGYGAGGIIFNQLQTQFINPDNYSPDKPYSDEYPDEKYFSKLHMDLLNRVPKVFLLMAGIFLALQTLGCLLMFENKTEIKKPSNINDDTQEADIESSESQPPVKKMNSLGLNYGDPNEGIPIAKLIRMPIFYVFMLMFLNAGNAASSVITFYKDFGQIFIKDDQFFSIIASISCLLNASGRLFWGRLIDKFPYKVVYLLVLTLSISLVSTFYLTKFIQIKEIFAVWVCAINFTVAGVYVITPTAVAKSFGQKYFTLIYGILIFINLPIGVATSFISISIDALGWFWYFIIGCCFSLIGFFAAFFFNVKKEDGNDI